VEQRERRDMSTGVDKRYPPTEPQDYKKRHGQHTTGKQPRCSHPNINIQRRDRYSEGYKLTRSCDFWFLVCNATTHLALELQQERIQVVCSNKVVRRIPTELKDAPATDLGFEDIVFF